VKLGECKVFVKSELEAHNSDMEKLNLRFDELLESKDKEIGILTEKLDGFELRSSGEMTLWI